MNCVNCGTANVPGAKYCSNCGAVLPITRNCCPNCGTYFDPGAQFCPRCGNPTAANGAVFGKDWLVALLLCIFLGGLGVHRFYCGKIGTGIIWLLTGGCFGIGWLVDIILIATDSFTDSNGMRLIKN